jgi:hypothetical protein
MGKINAHKVLVGKTEGKKPLGRPKRRRDDIKIDVKGIRWKGVDRCKVAQGRTQRSALENRQWPFRDGLSNHWLYKVSAPAVLALPHVSFERTESERPSTERFVLLIFEVKKKRQRYPCNRP